MLARFQVLLPYSIHVPVEDAGTPAERFQLGDLGVTVWRPYRSHISPADLGGPDAIPVMQLPHRLDPIQPQPLDKEVEIAGTSTILANALQVDFKRESFDRRKSQPK